MVAHITSFCNGDIWLQLKLSSSLLNF